MSLSKKVYKPHKRFSSTWKRPSSVEYPRVWRTFERTMKDGRVNKFKIQDATEEMYDKLIEMFFAYHVGEATWYRAAGVCEDKEAQKVITNYIKDVIFAQRVVLVCVSDTDETIVGLNFTGVCQNNDEISCWKGYESNESLQTLFKLYTELDKHIVNVYEKFNVDEYLHSYGMCVLPNYRGYKISVELLTARIPLCKAIGIKITSSVFSNMGAQKVASMSGFHEDSSVECELISKNTNVVIPIKNKDMKVMTLKIL